LSNAIETLTALTKATAREIKSVDGYATVRDLAWVLSRQKGLTYKSAVTRVYEMLHDADRQGQLASQSMLIRRLDGRSQAITGYRVKKAK